MASSSLLPSREQLGQEIKNAKRLCAAGYDLNQRRLSFRCVNCSPNMGRSRRTLTPRLSMAADCMPQDVDLVEPGLVDPTGVVRTALENAVSVASVLLLTEDNDRNPGAETRSDAGAGPGDMRFAY